jgi:hypothetical protein
VILSRRAVTWMAGSYALLVVGTAIFVATATLTLDPANGAGFAAIWLVLVAFPLSILVLIAPLPDSDSWFTFVFNHVALTVAGLVQAWILWRLLLRSVAPASTSRLSAD